MGKLWSEIEEILYYDGKPYILEILQADLLERNHDDPLAEDFGNKKTFELYTGKYHWPKMRADIKKYVQGYNICISSKEEKHKPYDSLQLLPILTYK